MMWIESTISLATRWLELPAIRWSLTAVYLLALAIIATYGVHRYWLVWLYVRTRTKGESGLAERGDARQLESLPRVTVQLPMYNEAAVVKRVIDAACTINYPCELLQIQVVDDSTDECAELARRRVEHWQSQGVDIQYLHRNLRDGFKAGALAKAIEHSTGEFVAIFDADFVPPADFLMRTLGHFADKQVGLVQGRWTHLNRNDSLLTRTQAICLDAHFLIEHAGRVNGDRWFNFNGTAGIWRRAAIDDAGGWQGDTLTEDVDLSYRAQAKGHRFVFRPDVECPAELPTTLAALKSQQHRWAKGTIQVAKKLLPQLMRSNVPAKVKLEAFFHLTHPVVYVAITLMALLLYPTLYVNLLAFGESNQQGVLAMFVGVSLFTLGTASAGIFYVMSQRVQNRSTFKTMLHLPFLMSMGIGLALNNAKGVLGAMFGIRSPFVRTPKSNTTGDNTHDDRNRLASSLPTFSAVSPWLLAGMETLMAAYTIECCRLSIVNHGTTISLPFLLLFAAGYLYAAGGSARYLFRHRRRSGPAHRLPTAHLPDM